MYWYTLNVIQTWSYPRFCLKRNVRNHWNGMILDPTSSVPTKDKRLLWAGLALTCDPIYSALYSVWFCISMLHTLHSSKLYNHTRVLSKTIWYDYIGSPVPQHYQHYVTLHPSTLCHRYISLHAIELYIITFDYTALLFVTFDYTALLFITFDYTRLHFVRLSWARPSGGRVLLPQVVSDRRSDKTSPT